ncbi:MAG TPA: DUF485 domain-containing protein [Actinomycetospora sp.]|nr:DUF485 domain-containing protein [Actinomycetospora sp.]
MSSTDDEPSRAPATNLSAYQEVQQSPDFVALRKRWRRFIFTLSGIFLAWFTVYVVLAGFATDFMNTRLGGTNLTVGLLFGLLQFVSTFIIATIYVWFADKHLDPEAERLKLRVEEKL